jgi:hypothetical protein
MLFYRGRKVALFKKNATHIKNQWALNLKNEGKKNEALIFYLLNYSIQWL